MGVNKIINAAVDLDKLIEAEIHALGFDFVGLEFDRHVTPNVLRVYADLNLTNVTSIGAAEKAEEVKEITSDDSKIKAKGITVEECGRISYHLNKVLSVASNLNLKSYLLEVSSPGIERRLFNLSQYEKYLGKTIKVRLYKVVENKRSVIGVLQSVDRTQNKIFLNIEGQDFNFNFDDIAKANLVYSKL